MLIDITNKDYENMKKKAEDTRTADRIAISLRHFAAGRKK